MAEFHISQSPEPEGAVVLDPEYSERQYYREPFTGYQREIWRPGDGDGSQSTDYYQRAGPVLPMNQRWRMFQSNIGPIGLGKEKAEPPRFVFLDDRAAFEIITSDIQRARLNRDWPHDFAANGKMRVRRTHCGRPAFKDRLKSEYHSTPLTKTSNYYFTGEKNYKPVIYRAPPPEPPEPAVQELIRKRRIEDAADPALYNPRAHGHNQFTPKDMMVKHGAPTFSRKKTKGKDIEMLATLKYQTPRMQMEKRLFAESGSRKSTSKAGSVWSRGNSVATHLSKAIAPMASPAIPTVEAAEHASVSSSRHQDRDESDSDMEIFPKADATPQRRVSTPAVTVASAVDIPRQMGYIDRRMHEQAVASKIMNAVQNRDDVVRIANELAEANVAIADQAKEIERLKKALKETRPAVQDVEGIVDEYDRVTEDMQGNGESMA